jgi:hypothetical protein
MKWLRKLIAHPEPQHTATSTPALHIRDTIPTSILLGRRLASLWGAHWSSVTGNHAWFAYGFYDDSFVVFPEAPGEKAFLECHLIDLDQSFAPIRQVTYGHANDTRLIGCLITDLFVPRDPETRYPDSQILQMASGFGIAQESGTPVGILPSLYLTKGVEEKMISIFATNEWICYEKSGRMA